MAHAEFVHLRVHSAYSLSEGAIPVNTLVELCVAKGMPAVAVTDTNNLFGALEFASAAAPAGVQPIIGCQLSLSREAPGRGGNGSARQGPEDAGALVVLTQNQDGYRHLLKLISLAYLGVPGDPPPSDPQVTLAQLEDFSGGLIALTGGPDGPVGRLLADGQTDDARALLERLSAAFPGRLYVELLRHGLKQEKQIEPLFLDLAYEMNLPIVATNECFFADATMHEAHDALICIAEGAYISGTDRRRQGRGAADHRLPTQHFPGSIGEERQCKARTSGRRCAGAAGAKPGRLPPPVETNQPGLSGRPPGPAPFGSASDPCPA